MSKAKKSDNSDSFQQRNKVQLIITAPKGQPLRETFSYQRVQLPG